MVAIKAGREVGAHDSTALHAVGCTAELRYAEAYEDGRFDIIAAGMTRFRLVEVDAAEPLRAEVELLPDDISESSISLAAAGRPAVQRLPVGVAGRAGNPGRC